MSELQSEHVWDLKKLQANDSLSASLVNECHDDIKLNEFEGIEPNIPKYFCKTHVKATMCKYINPMLSLLGSPLLLYPARRQGSLC